jgi:large subunit ribosomal protein L22
MEIKAKLNHLRITPRKVRLIADFIRNISIKEAKTKLKFIPNRAAEPVLKLLKSAIANAQNNFNVKEDDLYIKRIMVNQDTPFKRWFPISRGRSFPILKRACHIELVLGAKEDAKLEKIKQEAEKPTVSREEKIEKTQKIEQRPKFKASKAPEKIKSKGFRGFAKKIFRRKSV